MAQYVRRLGENHRIASFSYALAWLSPCQSSRKSLPTGKRKQLVTPTAGDNSQRRLHRRPSSGINFTEATGKLTAFINYQNDSPEWQALEVRYRWNTVLL